MFMPRLAPVERRDGAFDPSLRIPGSFFDRGYSGNSAIVPTNAPNPDLRLLIVIASLPGDAVVPLRR